MTKVCNTLKALSQSNIDHIADLTAVAVTAVCEAVVSHLLVETSLHPETVDPSRVGSAALHRVLIRHPEFAQISQDWIKSPEFAQLG